MKPFKLVAFLLFFLRKWTFFWKIGGGRAVHLFFWSRFVLEIWEEETILFKFLFVGHFPSCYLISSNPLKFSSTSHSVKQVVGVFMQYRHCICLEIYVYICIQYTYIYIYTYMHVYIYIHAHMWICDTWNWIYKLTFGYSFHHEEVPFSARERSPAMCCSHWVLNNCRCGWGESQKLHVLVRNEMTFFCFLPRQNLLQQVIGMIVCNGCETQIFYVH